MDEFNKMNNINFNINDISYNSSYIYSKIISLNEEIDNNKENLNPFNNDELK